MAVDTQHKQVFAGECKYHEKPVDADVYFDLLKKVGKSKEMQNAYQGYTFRYGVFSRSGFTKRLTDVAANNNELFLIQEDNPVKDIARHRYP